MKVLYKAHAVATGGRNGRVATDDGSVDHLLALPKELGGSGGPGANPEQLFACGYAACFDSALNFVASGQNVVLSGTQVAATVGIGPDGQGGFGLVVTLEVTIPGVPRDQGLALLETAHQVCPYSNAIRGNVEVNLSLR